MLQRGHTQSHQGPYRWVYYSGCSAGVSLSSLGYRPFPVWIAVERWAALRLTWFRLHCLLIERGRATWGKYSRQVWTLRSQFPWADPNKCLSSLVVSSQWAAFSAVKGNKKKINKKKRQQGEWDTMLELRGHRPTVYPSVKYLSLLLGTGMFPHVVRHGWSSHVSSRVSVRLCLRISARL